MMKRNPSQAKFSSIMDVLNGFILDGILGDFKEDELKLMHRNLKNIKELVNFKKIHFHFRQRIYRNGIICKINRIKHLFRYKT